MMLGINYATASECIDDDCELATTIVTETESEIPEQIDILEPQQSSNMIWAVQDTENTDSQYDCEYDYSCPFATDEECAVWYKKPVYKESVSPRAPRINSFKTENIIYALQNNVNMSANNAVFAPLIERYKMLMRASKSCCSEGIIYKLHEKDASDAQIYGFLKDDANYFAVGTRCLVMNNDDIDANYSNGVNGAMVTAVRNTCLCKNRHWFDSLLAPFSEIYQQVPEFKSAAFDYRYKDGLNRNITVSVNNDVQNTINMLASCPD